MFLLLMDWCGLFTFQGAPKDSGPKLIFSSKFFGFLALLPKAFYLLEDMFNN